MNTPRKLLYSDLKEPDGDAAKVLSVFNEFTDQQERENFVTRANVIFCVVSDTLLPVSVKPPIDNPVSVTIGRATLTDGSAAGVGLSIDWRLQGGQIVILAVYGATAGVQYRLSLLVV